MAGTQLPDDVLAGVAASNRVPKLLLHCCCAPCASYVLEYLSPFFGITAFFYNPNIMPPEEYCKRAEEIQKLLSQAAYPNSVDAIVCEYDAGAFNAAAAPFLDEPEGGRRCRACFELRLKKTAARAKAEGYDYFATTLSVSPHKNAALLAEIVGRLATEYGIRCISSDFKKRDGYRRSVELSKKYGLYRQNYCGCKLVASG